MLISISALFFTSVIMCMAMAVAWGSFGRPRQALSWAIGYGCIALQVLGGAIAEAVPRAKPYWWPFDDLLVIVSASLVAFGAFQRANRPDTRGVIAVAGSITFAVILLGDTVKPFDPVRASLASLFTVAMVIAAMTAVVPRGRTADPAERMMLAALGLFAAFELVVVALTFVTTAYPRDADARQFYDFIYYAGLPALFVATGVAAMMLLAADLAARLRRLAARDPLTGVHNRRGFQEAAERTIANARRQRVPITIAVVDIDHFKGINDRFGHTVGDHTLGHVAHMLADGVRSGDIVGRIGGEEFALLLFDSTAGQAAEVMERIRERIAEGLIDDGVEVPITASFGVAGVRHGPEALREIVAGTLDRADRALYKSKLMGRNRVTLAPTSTAT